MNYGQVKRAALQLIYSETIAGDKIPSTYNNQADYERQIPALVDACQQYIATTVRRIPQLTRLGDLEKVTIGNNDLYTLPADFFQISPGLITTDSGIRHPDMMNGVRVNDYKLYAGNKLMTGAGHEDWLLEYYRYPASVGENPKDNLPLDGTPEVQAAIPYYVAAHMVIYDDSFRYAAIWNEFQTRLSNLVEPTTTENTLVEDVYGGFGW